MATKTKKATPKPAKAKKTVAKKAPAKKAAVKVSAYQKAQKAAKALSQAIAEAVVEDRNEIGGFKTSKLNNAARIAESITVILS